MRYLILMFLIVYAYTLHAQVTSGNSTTVNIHFQHSLKGKSTWTTSVKDKHDNSTIDRIIVKNGTHIKIDVNHINPYFYTYKFEIKEKKYDDFRMKGVLDSLVSLLDKLPFDKSKASTPTLSLGSWYLASEIPPQGPESEVHKYFKHLCFIKNTLDTCLMRIKGTDGATLGPDNYIFVVNELKGIDIESQFNQTKTNQIKTNLFYPEKGSDIFDLLFKDIPQIIKNIKFTVGKKVDTIILKETFNDMIESYIGSLRNIRNQIRREFIELPQVVNYNTTIKEDTTFIYLSISAQNTSSPSCDTGTVLTLIILKEYERPAFKIDLSFAGVVAFKGATFSVVDSIVQVDTSWKYKLRISPSIIIPLTSFGELGEHGVSLLASVSTSFSADSPTGVGIGLMYDYRQGIMIGLGTDVISYHPSLKDGVRPNAKLPVAYNKIDEAVEQKAVAPVTSTFYFIFKLPI